MVQKKDKTYTLTIGNNHTHTLSLSTANYEELITNRTLTKATSETESHTHNVTIQCVEITDIQKFVFKGIIKYNADNGGFWYIQDKHTGVRYSSSTALPTIFQNNGLVTKVRCTIDPTSAKINGYIAIVIISLNHHVEITGNMKYSTSNNGYWYIQDNNSNNYIPINGLPSQYLHEDLTIKVFGYLESNLSVPQAGIPIKIIHIHSELTFTGTIKYNTLEGGFWYIDDNNSIENYIPINIDSTFKTADLVVDVVAKLRSDLSSTIMFGKLN